MSNKYVAAKFGVPKHTLSTWVKNKEKLLDALDIKRQKLETGNHVDKAVVNWFLSMRSQKSIIRFHDLKEGSYVCEIIGC